MRNRMLRVTMFVLVVTTLVTMGAALASGLYDGYGVHFKPLSPGPPTTFQQTAQQLQFGVPSPPLVKIPIELQPM